MHGFRYGITVVVEADDTVVHAHAIRVFVFLGVLEVQCLAILITE
jgi:hypothetical protein